MPSDDIAIQLRQLGFRVSVQSLRAFFEHATHSRLGPVEVCEKLLEMERREREGRNLAARMRLATLGKFSTLDRFDWNHPRQIDRKLYESLHGSLDFLDRGDNVLLRGPSGVGKTTLAQNLGLAANRSRPLSSLFQPRRPPDRSPPPRIAARPRTQLAP